MLNDYSYPTSHPILAYRCPVTGEQMALAFGYFSNEPAVIVYRGHAVVAMLPRDILVEALQGGWGGTDPWRSTNGS